MSDFGFELPYLWPKVCFSNNRFSKLREHHNLLQRLNSKFVENYAINYATISNVSRSYLMNNIEKIEKKPVTRMKRLKEKQKHCIPKIIFIFYVTTNIRMVSEFVHRKLKNVECSRP